MSTDEHVETPTQLYDFKAKKRGLDFSKIDLNMLKKKKSMAGGAVGLKSIVDKMKQKFKHKSLNSSINTETSTKGNVFGDISMHVKNIKLFKINPNKLLKFKSTDEI